MTKADPLEYVLNRMEYAARMSNPAQHGYPLSRKELLDGITSLRAERDCYRAAIERHQNTAKAVYREARDAELYATLERGRK